MFEESLSYSRQRNLGGLNMAVIRVIIPSLPEEWVILFL